jgi:hypothetical protein
MSDKKKPRSWREKARDKFMTGKGKVTKLPYTAGGSSKQIKDLGLSAGIRKIDKQGR